MLDSVHIRLLTYRIATLEPLWWRFKSVQDSFWRLYFHDRDGAVVEQINQQRYELEPQRIYFIPAGVHYSSHTSREIREFYVHFDVLGLSQPVQKELFGTPLCLSSQPALIEQAQSIQEQMVRNELPDIALQMRIKALIYESLAFYLQSLPVERIERSLRLAQAQEPVLPALRYIEGHINETLLNSELANLCHMQVDYFVRRFRECMGQTPGQYIQELRVKLAAQRLLFTDLSIEQIASEVGFGNRFYFSRIFARHTGVSPAAYRKNSHNY